MVKNEDFIAHYGVKGQKWGVRRDRKRVTASTTKTNSSTSPKTMSDAQLKAVVNRMNMERNYQKLMAEQRLADRSSVEKGRDAVLSILQKSGQEAAKNFVTSQMTQAIKNAASGRDD